MENKNMTEDNTIKQIRLIFQRSVSKDGVITRYGKPFTMIFSYSERFCKIPTTVLLEKLDEAYAEMKNHLIKELENENK